MTLRLLDRITMLLKADAHGVVESLEERSLLLKQYLREAELDLDRKRARLEAVREDEKRLCAALAACEAEQLTLDEDVTLALAADKGDLARFAVRRLLSRRGEAGGLRAQIEQRATEAQALAARLTAQEEQFEALRTRVRVELTRASDPLASAPWACGGAVADEAVEIELLRRRRAAEDRP